NMQHYSKKPVRYGLNIFPFLVLFSTVFLLFSFAQAQPFTGYWKGKIDRKNVEVKIIKNGDSLTGTSYYYESASSYRRYSIKGYFDERDNSVVWWDDQLIEEKKGKRLLPAAGAIPYLSTADFNCPGGTTMYLNGNAALKEKKDKLRGPVDLQKYGSPVFHDEWDFVIDTYTVGGNDPELIDSIGKLAFYKPIPEPKELIIEEPLKPAADIVIIQSKKNVTLPPVKKETELKPTAEVITEPVAKTPALSIKEKFVTRSKVILQEIPLSGDSIELRFYDNAEIDGDSISIFLNDQLLYEHIRLTEKAYIIKLAVTDLQQSNELVMVAENLGSIPPNTSLMVAMVDGKRYEARLESTEQSSAGIRFIRKNPL
ncbi:MAG: hypothetical protein WBP16_14390, partial [Ferruginibacter sp.]